MSQRTFSIVKPDAVKKGYTAAILAKIEAAGFKIVSIKRMSISKAQAEGFYYVHAERGFFGELTDFMSSGPIFPMVLEKDNAIADFASDYTDLTVKDHTELQAASDDGRITAIMGL